MISVSGRQGWREGQGIISSGVEMRTTGESYDVTSGMHQASMKQRQPFARPISTLKLFLVKMVSDNWKK